MVKRNDEGELLPKQGRVDGEKNTVLVDQDRELEGLKIGDAQHKLKNRVSKSVCRVVFKERRRYNRKGRSRKGS